MTMPQDRQHDKAPDDQNRFEAGPASVVRLSSRMIFLKLRVMTGVGLAQPIRNPLNRLKPQKRAENDERRKQQRADRVDVIHGIERDPALQARRLVAQPRGHPRMRALMHAQGKKQQNELKDCNEKAVWLQRDTPRTGNSG